MPYEANGFYHVYQSKTDSWKSVLRLNALQEAAWAERTQPMAPPLAKTLKRLLGRNVTRYAPRKGFAWWAWEHGHDLEQVKEWMGHTSIVRTSDAYLSWKQHKRRKG